MQHTLLHTAVLEPNGKRLQAVHDRPFVGQQQTRPDGAWLASVAF
ncbi:MAG TPA: hypothetical protein VH164_16125 [Ktedonobacteraceae bacterium]|nr:hypothetical protein [Ktedonobacteraceae bacterium]